MTDSPHSDAHSAASKQNDAAIKSKVKPRRKARRRGEQSDSEADGAATDDSLSDASSVSDDDDEDETVPVSARPDVTSTVDVSLSNDGESSAVAPFDEFNRHTDPVRGGHSVRGRTRGGKSAGREFTDEEKQRYETRIMEKKERLKAKRKEGKEAKRKERESKDLASKQNTEAVSSLTASAAALTLDEPTQEPTQHSTVDDINQAGRPNNRTAYTQRMAEDPKFTPRVGNFWMHDQRHYQGGKVGDGSYSGLRTMSDFWRGRGAPRGAPRGGPRGRGRGFISSGSGSRGSTRPDLIGEDDGGKNKPRLTEMDKLELELAQAERQRAKLRPQEPAPAENDEPLISRGERKWGHEGFEEYAATEDIFRANRAATLRARGRGRGRLTPRGGFLPRATVAHLPTPDTSPDRSNTVDASMVGIKEGTATQPAAESLLGDATSVTIKLPGSTVAVEANPLSQPTVSTDRPSLSLHAAASTVPNIALGSTSNPSPQPYIAGSENGSISSSGHFVPPVPVQLPPGIGVTPTGEYYNVASGPPVNFRPPVTAGPPTGSPGFYPRGYPSAPQSFTPEPGFHPPRGSFSSAGYFSAPSSQGSAGYSQVAPGPRQRAGSPFYPGQPPMGGYFVPPRPTQKIAIRAPIATDDSSSPKSPNAPQEQRSTDSTGVNGMLLTPAGAPMGQNVTVIPPGGYYPQHYNPYAGGAPDGQRVYYPPHGTGFWQGPTGSGGGYVEPGAFGYEPDYPGY